MIRSPSLGALLAGVALLVLRPGAAMGETPPLKGVGKVYFVPIGQFSSPSMPQLMVYYKRTFGLTIEVMSGLQFESSVLDFDRRQVIAEELIALMKRQYPQLANDPQAILIGITNVDMYIRQMVEWQWAFSFRQEGRFAVVSSARMDPGNWDLPPDSALLHTRLQKMISKNLGILYYRLPESKDRSSVVFGPILGLDDLDSIGEDF